MGRGLRMQSLCNFIIPIIIAGLTNGLAHAQQPSKEGVMRVDPALDALIAPNAKLERVAGGFGFTEGTIWVQKGKRGYLLFSDIPANVIYKLTPDDGKVS